MNLREVVDFARRLSSAEEVSFATEATITCTVAITLTNTPEKGVRVSLFFPEFEGISLLAGIEASYVASPSAEELTEHHTRVAETGEGSPGLPVSSLPVTLSAEEVCRIFGISANAEWEMTNHGMFLGEQPIMPCYG